jgi:hypothetical protein
MCDDAQTILRKLVEAKCNATNVVCVYKKDGDCDDWCSPNRQCGYRSDNWFVQFHDFSCDATATSPTSVTGWVSCRPEITTEGIAVLAAAAVALSGWCCCMLWCCCCRRRKTDAAAELLLCCC